MPGFSSTSRRPAARAFTLIEIVLVIAILLALGALILPNIAASLADRAFDAASEDIRTQLLLARAHAQSTNQAVELIYESPDVSPAKKPTLRARTLDAALRAIELDETPTSAAVPNRTNIPAARSSAVQSPAIAVDTPSTIPEPWAVRTLAADFSITSQSPPSADSAVDSSAVAPRGPADFIRNELPSLDPPSTATPLTIRLAVFMADGSALLGGPVWLTDAEGRTARIFVNAWTGLPEVDRLPDREAGGTSTSAASATPFIPRP